MAKLLQVPLYEVILGKHRVHAESLQIWVVQRVGFTFTYCPLEFGKMLHPALKTDLPIDAVQVESINVSTSSAQVGFVNESTQVVMFSTDVYGSYVQLLAPGTHHVFVAWQVVHWPRHAEAEFPAQLTEVVFTGSTVQTFPGLHSMKYELEE
jgi:hypothetical protein